MDAEGWEDEAAFARFVGQRVKEEREERGLSHERLGWVTHISRETIRKIEAGEQSPRTYTLYRIASGFGMSLCDLLRGRDSNPQPAGLQTNWGLTPELSNSDLLPITNAA